MSNSQIGKAPLELILSATEALRRALSSLASGERINVGLMSPAFAAVRHLRDAQGVETSGHHSCTANSQLEGALRDYYAALREWHRELPRLRGWLLAEKARLEDRRRHAESVRNWVEASRPTR